MAGRGRGRGRGKGLSFNVESLGFGRGEALPGTILEPPPAYPPLEIKAVPLATGDHYDYLLALKQEYRANMKESLYYIKPTEKRKDIERYSDKYQEGQQENKQGNIVWSSLPKELHPRQPKKRKAKLKKGGKAKKLASTDQIDVSKRFEELEKKETSEPTEEEADAEEEEEEDEENPTKKKKKKENEEEEEGAEVEEDVEEEELEDETDYAMTYFDNGENYGLDEDDDLEDEGAIY